LYQLTKMCKCFFRFAKCLAVFVNVILLILGLGCLGGGIYALTQIDVKDLLGKTYNDSVPPIETFVPNEAKNDQTAILTTKASKFVDESMEKIGRTSKKIFIGLVGLGAVMVFITLLGIMAFSCCNKNSCFVIVYLILLILVLVPFIVMTVFTADESFFKGMIFAKLDDLALKKEFVNRYFMAALQSQLKCCGVRGSVDYFCHGIYDFACNPGCMTFNRFWKAMVDKAGENNLKPMCTRVPEMVEQCRKMADKAEKIKKQNQNLKNLGQTGAALPPELAAFTKENCEKKMNVPKPVNGQTSEFCKSDNIENHFGKDGGWPKKRTMLEEALAKFDPAKKRLLWRQSLRPRICLYDRFEARRGESLVRGVRIFHLEKSGHG